MKNFQKMEKCRKQKKKQKSEKNKKVEKLRGFHEISQSYKSDITSKSKTANSRTSPRRETRHRAARGRDEPENAPRGPKSRLDSDE